MVRAEMRNRRSNSFVEAATLRRMALTRCGVQHVVGNLVALDLHLAAQVGGHFAKSLDEVGADGRALDGGALAGALRLMAEGLL